MPAPERPHIPTITPGTNQESQDDYGSFDLDMDDPELIAALGDVAQSVVVARRKAKDEALCRVRISSSLTDVVDCSFRPLNPRI